MEVNLQTRRHLQRAATSHPQPCYAGNQRLPLPTRVLPPSEHADYHQWPWRGCSDTRSDGTAGLLPAQQQTFHSTNTLVTSKSSAFLTNNLWYYDPRQTPHRRTLQPVRGALQLCKEVAAPRDDTHLLGTLRPASTHCQRPRCLQVSSCISSSCCTI